MPTEQTEFTLQQLRTHPTVAAIYSALARTDLEEALLGALLYRPKLVNKIIGVLTAGDFADQLHGAVFQEIADRTARGESVDHNLLQDIPQRFAHEFETPELARRFLVDLMGRAGVDVAARDYAVKLAEVAKRRRLVDVLLAGVAEAPETDQPFSDISSSIITAAERLLEARRLRTRAEVLADVVAEMERPSPCFSTGLPCLDKAMGGGLYAGKVYGFAGLGKAGKTLVAGNISHALNLAGVKHAYFAFEMGAAQIEHRQIARDLGTHSLALLGNVRTEILARVGRYAAQVRQEAPDNVLYCDMPGGSFAELRAEIMAARHQHGVKGIIVDYWQLVKGKAGPSASEEEHLQQVAEWLAAATARLGIFTVVLAQLADDGEATAKCRTGLDRNADQLYFIRGASTDDFRWLEQRRTRYTPPGDVGSKEQPALKKIYPGPHFMDLTTTSERQAQREMAE